MAGRLYPRGAQYLSFIDSLVQSPALCSIDNDGAWLLASGQYRGSAGASDRHPDEPEFQVDFLTLKVADIDEPIRIEQLDVTLQPLRFMEFSLQGVQQTTLLDSTGLTHNGS